ncbi:hypothetical protein LEMLEM_LOCUS24296 [Lemmus lemmus]
MPLPGPRRTLGERVLIVPRVTIEVAEAETPLTESPRTLGERVLKTPRMMVQGYQQSLESGDLWSLNKEDTSEAVPMLEITGRSNCAKSRNECHVSVFSGKADVA